jgi:hypothetical protein
MINQVFYDEVNGVMREKYLGNALIDEAQSYFSHVAELFEGKSHRYTIIDLSEASDVLLKKNVRALLVKEGGRVNYEKIAYINVSPILRMAAKILHSMARIQNPNNHKTRINFFSEEEDAMSWLKG